MSAQLTRQIADALFNPLPRHPHKIAAVLNPAPRARSPECASEESLRSQNLGWLDSQCTSNHRLRSNNCDPEQRQNR